MSESGSGSGLWERFVEKYNYTHSIQILHPPSKNLFLECQCYGQCYDECYDKCYEYCSSPLHLCLCIPTAKCKVKEGRHDCTCDIRDPKKCLSIMHKCICNLINFNLNLGDCHYCNCNDENCKIRCKRVHNLCICTSRPFYNRIKCKSFNHCTCDMDYNDIYYLYHNNKCIHFENHRDFIIEKLTISLIQILYDCRLIIAMNFPTIITMKLIKIILYNDLECRYYFNTLFIFNALSDYDLDIIIKYLKRRPINNFEETCNYIYNIISNIDL